MDLVPTPAPCGCDPTPASEGLLPPSSPFWALDEEEAAEVEDFLGPVPPPPPPPPPPRPPPLTAEQLALIASKRAEARHRREAKRAEAHRRRAPWVGHLTFAGAFEAGPPAYAP